MCQHIFWRCSGLCITCWPELLAFWCYIHLRGSWAWSVLYGYFCFLVLNNCLECIGGNCRSVVAAVWSECAVRLAKEMGPETAVSEGTVPQWKCLHHLAHCFWRRKGLPKCALLVSISVWYYCCARICVQICVGSYFGNIFVMSGLWWEFLDMSLRLMT